MSIRSRENALAIPVSNVYQIRPYRRPAVRQRRWAWWAALLFFGRPGKPTPAKSMPDVGSGEIVKFRRQAAAARW